MREDIKKIFDKNGVSYYNKDNKENKENSDTVLAHLPLDRTTSSEATPLKNVDVSLAALSSERDSQEEGRSPESIVTKQAETPPRIGIVNPGILPEEVDRCLLTYYDNGPNARMRYRLGITINPNEAPGERWEFIANLNKDPRIFRRNIPDENRQFVYDFGNAMRDECKRRYQKYPMLGKIHSNSKLANSTNQKEDGCAAAVYWTGSSWCATVMLWEYVIKDIELTDSLLTAKQIKQNTKAVSGIIYGPCSVSKAKWQKQAQPTFKQRRNK